MTPRAQFFSLMKRESAPVLSWFMAFFNEKTAQRLLGTENVQTDCIPDDKLHTGACSTENRQRKLAYAKACGHFAIGVGHGGGFAFGHGGPGEFGEWEIETGENFRIAQFETGVKKEVKYNPHFYHHFNYPVDSATDLDKITLPDPHDPARYAGIQDESDFYKAQGYATFANLNGFFSGIHYFLYPYDKLFEDLLLEPEFIHAMLDKLGAFNLAAAEKLLQCGVDMITFCDDLGNGTSLLMSPALYREFFLPWHKKLADLCHQYGAYLHMHSHGNINKIIDDIADSGVDLLNPLDPCDGMDLPALKAKYNDRMTFVGGIDKFFFEWDYDKQRDYIFALAKNADGGFILMDSGGVPENVTKEQFERIRAIFHDVKAAYNQFPGKNVDE